MQNNSTNCVVKNNKQITFIFPELAYLKKQYQLLE